MTANICQVFYILILFYYMKKTIWYTLIAIGLGSFILIALLIYLQNPLENIVVASFQISPPLIFLGLLLIGIFCLGSALLKNIRYGGFAAIVVGAFFIMRFFGFRSLVHILLLLIIVILVEVVFFRTSSNAPSNNSPRA